MRKLFPKISRCPGMLFLVMLFCGMAFAQEGSVNLILSVKKADIAKVKKAIEAVKGQVRIEHKYVDAMAITLPANKVENITALPEVISSQKDMMVNIPEPRNIEKKGYGVLPGKYDVAASAGRALSEEELNKIGEPGTDLYFPYTNNLTNTNSFYYNVGKFGEGIIVAVIDAGISSAAWLVADRIVGAENFTNDGRSATDPTNNSHGTWVACCIGGNGIVNFANNAVPAAVERYSPESVLPDFFGPGEDGVPLLGQAPEALFYALKVFPYNSNSTPTSIIAAALERAIELKELYLAGQGGSNIRIINMSLGGLTFFAGNDPVYAPLLKRALDDGMFLAISAGNDGPSGMTIGDPGDIKNVVTVGATTDATHERILRDLQFGANAGLLFRPVNNNFVVDFSSRGPNADGRPDPDIVAPGDLRLAQSASGNFSFVSGTSFAAPTVAGAAALLLSVRPDATPAELRGALLNSANCTILDGEPTIQDQGFGFLNVYHAYQKLMAGVFNPPDIGMTSPYVAVNAGVQGMVNIANSPTVMQSSGLLEPGERFEIYYPITSLTNKVTVNITNITPALPPDEQNPVWGDDLQIAVQTAVTSNADYLVGPSLLTTTDKTFVFEGQDLSVGLMRITLVGDWTNAGEISANIYIESECVPPENPDRFGAIAQGQIKIFNIKVPQGTGSLEAKLNWVNGWNMLPTTDLDMILRDPNGAAVILDENNDNYPDGQTVRMPEIITVEDPVPGTWTASIIGYEIIPKKEQFQLYLDIEAAAPNKSGGALAADASIPAEFALAQNMPNPFNPTTMIRYDLPTNAGVSLKIYNSLGELVRTLVNQIQPAGRYSVMFDGKDNTGNQLSSGMYIYQISAGSFVRSAKMLMLK